MTTNLLIRDVEVLQLSGGIDLLHHYDIHITGDRIAAVTPTDTAATTDAKQVIDGAGMIALPGFINAHAHTAMVLFRGIAEDVNIESWFNDYIFPVESNETAEDVYWGTLLGIAEMIEAGVTTVADHYFHMDIVAKAVQESGMRANLVIAMFGNSPTADADLDDASEFIARWQGQADGRITAWLGPHSLYLCPHPFLRKVADRAQALGVGTHIHVSETKDQLVQSVARYGRTPVEILEDVGLLAQPLIGAHTVHVTENDLDLLAKSGAGVVHCPKTFLKLASGIAPITRMRERGIPVAFGTDGAASNSTMNVLEAARLAALLQKHERQDSTVQTVAQTFGMAFTDSPRVLHLDGQIGALQPGMLADLVLIRQDGAHMQPAYNIPANILYNAQPGDVDTTICNGRVLMQGRKLLTLDKAQIVREVSARLGRLHARTSGQRIQTYQA